MVARVGGGRRLTFLEIESWMEVGKLEQKMPSR